MGEDETDMLVFNKNKLSLEILSLNFTDTYYNAKSLLNQMKQKYDEVSKFIEEGDDKKLLKHKDLFIFPI